MIMLGGLNADKDLLMDLSGDRGAFAYAYNIANIQNVVQDWAASLSHVVKFTGIGHRFRYRDHHD